jgi:hypothetical protein
MADKKTTPTDELADLGIDARLDNRTGDQRPTVPTKPKPQQIDGPEVGHEREHAEQNPPVEDELGEPLGTKSEGPHGLGPHGVTVGDAHGQPVEPQAGAGEDDPRNPKG